MEVYMITRFKLLGSLLLVALTSLTFGCGGGSSTATTTATPPNGKLVKGPVAGAVVFADRIDRVGANGSPNLVLDTDEVWTTTDANGKYTLPKVPAYKYVLVSLGGQDTYHDPAVKQDVIMMMAPAGSANITLLTTLVALDTTGQIYKKLQPLQSAPLNAALDFDVSTSSTPATLLLMKSIEYAVQSITYSVTSKSAITPQQVAIIQFQALQQIALEFAKPASDLATTAGLKTALTTALVAAIAEINKAVNIEITSAASAAASIADNALANATNLNPALFSVVTLNVTSITPEKSLALPALFSSTFKIALSATSAAISAWTTVTTSGSTPSPYGPINISILTIPLPEGIITGSYTGGTGSGTGGGF
jgi:hypothetical protein